MHSQYLPFLGTCFYHFMEGHDEWLIDKECDNMIYAGMSWISTGRSRTPDAPPPPKTPLGVFLSKADFENSSSQPTARTALIQRAIMEQRVSYRSSNKPSSPWSRVPLPTWMSRPAVPSTFAHSVMDSGLCMTARSRYLSVQMLSRGNRRARTLQSRGFEAWR